MNTTFIEDNIPTLTDIVHPGDISMKNHFEVLDFDKIEQPQETGGSSETTDELIETIELLVQDALNETLPAIEDQLKAELTRKVLEKLQQRF